MIPSPAAAPYQPPADLPEGVLAGTMTEGHALFMANCRRCHGTQGRAGVPLAGNPRLNDGFYISAVVVQGRGYMPSFAALGDEDVAAIATFVINSWGNSGGPVAPHDVHDLR